LIVTGTIIFVLYKEGLSKKLPITAIFKEFEGTTDLVLVYIYRYPPLNETVLDVPVIKLGRGPKVRSLLSTLKDN